MNNYTAIICYHVFTADAPAPFQGRALSMPHQKGTGDAGVSPADGLVQTAQLRIVRINN